MASRTFLQTPRSTNERRPLCARAGTPLRRRQRGPGAPEASAGDPATLDGAAVAQEPADPRQRPGPASPHPFFERSAASHDAGQPAAPAPGIDLSLGEPRRQSLPSHLMQRVLVRPDVNRYGAAFGLPALRAIIASRYAPDVDPSSHAVLVTHGAIHGIDLILRAVLRPGDEVLIPDPGFPPYRRLAELAGATVNTYPMGTATTAFGFDVGAMADAITSRTRILVINSPHNPTGVMLSLDHREALRRLLACRHPGLQVISDEVYGGIVFDGADHHTLAGISPRTYVVNSFSKSHSMQGLRVGWILAPAAEAARLEPWLVNAVGCVSSLGQEIAFELLTSRVWRPCGYGAAKVIAETILSERGLRFQSPQGAFFLLVETRDDLAAAQALAAEGIRVVAGRAFGDRLRGWLRVSFAQDDRTVARGFERFATALARFEAGAS